MLVEVVTRGQEMRHITATYPPKMIPTTLTASTMALIKEGAEEIGM